MDDTTRRILNLVSQYGAKMAEAADAKVRDSHGHVAPSIQPTWRNRYLDASREAGEMYQGIQTALKERTSS